MRRAALFLLATMAVWGTQVAADDMSDCTNDAGRARYSDEALCYNSYGVGSGRWSTQDTSALDTCLENVHADFSATVEVCSDMYFVEVDKSFNGPAAASAGSFVGFIIYLLM